jgi:hypothetical protein
MFQLRSLWVLLLIALCPLVLLASPAKDLEKAAKKGQVAFIIFTDGKTADISGAKAAIQDAMKQVKKSVMIELDRSDNTNAEIVTKYRLSTIPAPMILALNPNGVISGAIQPDKATPEILAKMIPSPKKAEVMKALSDGNAVFITVGSKDMKTGTSVSDSCAIACQKASGRSVCVSVDMNDKEEKAFLTELKIDTAASEPVTIVTNPQGQISAKYVGAVKVDDLIQASTKKIGGCCPPKVTGGSAACPPAKK